MASIARSGASRARAFIALTLVAVLLGVPEAPALSRETILARGKRWVDLKVPYSNSLRFEGYRQDCSGFLSMAWMLAYSDGSPKSLDTAGLDDASLVTAIAKDELQPGDMILRPKDQPGAAYGHAVLFVGWADPQKTKYLGYHQSSSAGGAVLAQIKYPFWNETGFAPYRMKAVGDDYLDVIEPIYGPDRYETSVRASWLAYPTVGSAKAIVVATGSDWPDALGGAALAGAAGGPMLLTRTDSLPPGVRDEIDRLDVSKVYVLGGGSAVSTAVVDAIDAIPGVARPERLGGRDRYETAALVAGATRAALTAAGRAYDGGVYVATGLDFPDALAGSPVSAATGRPILLTRHDSVPQPTMDALAALGAGRAWVLGGTAAVSETVTAGFSASGLTVERLAGATRYQTSVAVANHAVAAGLGWRSAGMATGTSFPDALAGGVAQGAQGGPLLLTPGYRLDPDVRAVLAANRSDIVRLRFYGGLAALSDTTRSQAASVMRGR